ncbi:MULTISPECIES: hypothetical protein [unclassified Herbaspirillum]|uniref:hypothetical protein n=1 Tax=unclassified Herbaspirillum TaxID=2624150 RepID=UPI001151B103|nr:MULTISPECIES: hypothetical protein [unclassified Herbaspirillum]MBB5392843.1 hypothetical protein [Herbaspirillum sp. SJZ102]TQK04510.1 hypothetical protein FB599_3067 [Herbaspirillum sp. SJZ130]TQK09705.1 hypothetical protein FB598_2695 [Herbaspirillum sp. SJZ106]
MRRLLLLLLTFLLPLQLLAATVGDLPPAIAGGQEQRCAWEPGAAALPGSHGSSGSIADGIAPAADAVQDMLAVAMGAVLAAELPQPAVSVSAADQPGLGDEDGDFPAPQAESEDHTMPARIATPDASWQPFPHLFTAPSGWLSFLRDQLRPPPLA